MEKVKTFAKGMSFYKLFWIFLIASVVGAYYEQIYYFIETWITTGTPVWELRRGVIYGPFNIIYGMGAVALVLMFGNKKYPKWKTFLIGAIGMGAIEYVCSLGFELIFHAKSWDYSSHWLNIGGRTSVPVMIIWGIAAVLMVYCIYPFLSKWIEKIPYKTGVIVTNILVVFMALNMLVSWTALIRQDLRYRGCEPATPVGEFYDQHYTDEYLKKYFPNMNKVE